jgi:cyclopropane fatty-acyl-phospholipid synthase-like methyltransferase
MDWINILKKNDKDFEKETKKPHVEETVFVINDPNIKNYEDEFDIKYSHVIAFDVIEHIYPEQIARLFKTLSNRMVQGGKMFIVTPLSEVAPNER